MVASVRYLGDEHVSLPLPRSFSPPPLTSIRSFRLMAREGLRQDLDRSIHMSDLMISFNKSVFQDPTTSDSSKSTQSAGGLNTGDLSDQKGNTLPEVREVEVDQESLILADVPSSVSKASGALGEV